jgi:hypothetical protein
MLKRSGFTPRIAALSGALLHFATGLLGLAYLALLSWLDDPEELHKRINPTDGDSRDFGPPA